jgi:hypothetical protein
MMAVTTVFMLPSLDDVVELVAASSLLMRDPQPLPLSFGPFVFVLCISVCRLR